MKHRIKKIAGWIHATLLFTLIVPLFYAFSLKRSVSVEHSIYAKGFLILLPVIATSFAISKCRHFISYLFWSVIIFDATMAFAYALTIQMPYAAVRFGFLLVIGIETVALIVDRYLGRLNMKEKEETKDILNPSWKPEHNIFEKPDFLLLIYFGIIYVAGLNLASKSVCDEAFFGAILYFFVTAWYQSLEQTKEYLNLNEGISNLPGKRIYGMNRFMLRIFLMFAAVIALLSFLLIPNRNYNDIRQLSFGKSISQKVFTQEDTVEPIQKDPMEQIKKEYGNTKSAPFWLEYIADAIGVIIFVVFLSFAIKAISKMSKTFRDSFDENGDIIEELKSEKILPKKKEKNLVTQEMTQREKIRKQYRKFIRKHKKEPPNQSDSPLEIEKGAKVDTLEETKEIHELYEKARYSKPNLEA